MSLSKFNKSFNKVEWGIDTKSLPFKKCSELEIGKEYPLRGCFVTPDRGYGLGAVLITDGYLVNIPNRHVDDIKSICEDAEAVEQIKSGHAGFVVGTFESKQFHRTGYSIEFTDK